jgi:hypothetical protein
MIKRVKIYFNDLEPEAQVNLLEAFETTEEDENNFEKRTSITKTIICI